MILILYLGMNASKVIKIVDEVGNKHSLRVRIRGQGSGFLEGNIYNIYIMIMIYIIYI